MRGSLWPYAYGVWSGNSGARILDALKDHDETAFVVALGILFLGLGLIGLLEWATGRYAITRR